MYWRATVERPDGNGGWIVVGVFGTPAGTGDGISRYVFGDTALEAAQIMLDHVWPVNLAEFNNREDLGKWRDGREAKTGIADHRITIDVDESNRWSVPYSQTLPEPLTITVAELRLRELRAEAAALAEARAKLKALNEQVRKARGDVSYRLHRRESAAEEAIRAGVAKPDVTKAYRAALQPHRKPRGGDLMGG